MSATEELPVMPYRADLIAEWERAYMAGKGFPVGHRADTTTEAVRSWSASFPHTQSFRVPFAANRLGQLLVVVGWGMRAGTKDLAAPDIWFVRYSAKGPWAVLLGEDAKVHLP